MLSRTGFVAFFAFTLRTSAANPKRGLAFAERDGRDVPQIAQAGSAISWLYDWGSSRPPYLAALPAQYVPMQWGTANIDNFAAAVNAGPAGVILGYNEPDLASQSAINATYGAELWLKYIQPLKSSGVVIGAPAVSSAPTGRVWLSDFLAACKGCAIDFVPLHWYGTGAGNFYNYIQSMHEQFPSYPLWVTEFADTSPNDADVADFLKQTIQYLDTLDWIQRYAWFGYFRDDGVSHYNLLDVNGNLTPLGHVYVGL